MTYRLFEYEIGEAWSEECRRHRLDGEVALIGEEQTEFISWCSEPVQYCIGRSPESFFRAKALHSVDVSGHLFWHQLIDRDVSIRFIDPQRQVLQIEAAGCVVFVSSQYDDGEFQGDCVWVSRTNPLEPITVLGG